MKIHYQLFNNQSVELSSSSEIGNIIQDREKCFTKNPTLGLPEVSKLIDPVMSKRQGHRMKHSFLEKKIRHKRENKFPMNTQKYQIN